MTKKTVSLSYLQIFLFWVPLSLTWLMMSVEGPYIAAIIARLDGEKLNLAAYGIAFAFALVAESPVIMLMSAATALCRNSRSYMQLRNFSILISLAVTFFWRCFSFRRFSIWSSSPCSTCPKMLQNWPTPPCSVFYPGPAPSVFAAFTKGF